MLLAMIAHLWAWAWADLGVEPPSLRDSIVYGAAVVALSGVLWWLLVAVTL